MDKSTVSEYVRMAATKLAYELDREIVENSKPLFDKQEVLELMKKITDELVHKASGQPEVEKEPMSKQQVLDFLRSLKHQFVMAKNFESASLIRDVETFVESVTSTNDIEQEEHAQGLYARNKVSAIFDEMSDEDKVEILYGALDYMQEYNGRSKFECMSMSMGYYEHSDHPGMYFKSK